MSDSTCYDIVTIEEIKEWCRIDNDDDDLILDALRCACVDWAEKYTNKHFIQRNSIMYTEKLSESKYENGPYIQIIKAPLLSLVLVESFVNGVYTTVDSSYYSLKRSSSIPRVVFSNIPQYDRTEAQPFRLSLITGYGPNTDDIPTAIRRGVLTHILYLYENRGDVISEGGISVPLEAICLYNKYRSVYVI